MIWFVIFFNKMLTWSLDLANSDLSQKCPRPRLSMCFYNQQKKIHGCKVYTIFIYIRDECIRYTYTYSYLESHRMQCAYNLYKAKVIVLKFMYVYCRLITIIHWCLVYKNNFIVSAHLADFRCWFFSSIYLKNLRCKYYTFVYVVICKLLPILFQFLSNVSLFIIQR